MMLKPYQTIPIQDCGEPLIPIPLDIFAQESPHAYVKLGADYQGKSPYFLRSGVVDGLIQAQSYLQKSYPHWRIKIFDAFRPLTVQQFMVDYTFQEVLKTRNLSLETLSPREQQALWQEVYTLWAVPSDDPSTPPPHSTGAAVDVTLVDAQGKDVPMGGEIDEFSQRSHPDYYTHATSPSQQNYHCHRELLKTVMQQGGFRRHPGEWWHFSLGDQMWVWLGLQQQETTVTVARYGRV